MKQLVVAIKIIIELIPFIEAIIEFLEALREIKRNSGNDVANQISEDMKAIAKQWKEHYNNPQN